MTCDHGPEQVVTDARGHQHCKRCYADKLNARRAERDRGGEREVLLVVPVDVLQGYFMLGSLSTGEVANRLGWVREYRGRIIGDTQRVKRTLGLTPYNSAGKSGYRTHMNYSTAVLMAKALGVEPTDAGI